MGNIFAASEVVELGVLIEKNGRDFYSSLAASSNQEKIREAFKFLAKEEEKHIKIFEGILAGVSQYQPQEAYQGEYLAYMKTLADEHVFTQQGRGKEIAGKIKSDREAIEMAIGFEKDSIVFYEGMRKIVPQEDERIVGELIHQEETHLALLLGLK